MALCKRCQNFDIQAFSRDTYAYRGYPAASFIRAAHAGCSFCSTLLEHFLAAQRGKNSPQLKYLSIELRKQSGEGADVKWLSGPGFNLLQRWFMTVLAPIWVHFRVRRGAFLPSRGTDALNIVALEAFVSPFSMFNALFKSSRSQIVEFHLGADPGTPAAASQDITGRIPIETSTWGPTHVEAVSGWLRDCTTHHQECSKTLSRTRSFDAEDVPLPTRCVEIITAVDTAAPGPDDDIDMYGSVGFILRETAGMRGRYVALSHRWGEDTRRTRTMRRNHRRRLRRCHRPTQLALEAALHALSLGVRYVWIDSWCIVQDDEADWARESVRMADYYQHAWLTISATTLAPHGGLVGTVAPGSMPALARLPYRDKEGRKQGYFYAQCVGDDRLAQDYVRHVSRSPLLRRGWVYQEWMLSRRLLAFSAAGIFMQCQESAPKGVTGDRVQRWAELHEETSEVEPEGFNDLAFKSALDFDLSSVRSVRASWLTAVETYSGLGLTHLETDRLIALAGVAKEFGAALEKAEKEGTGFGHPRGLEWEQVTQGPRVRVQGLPTWSWASMATLMNNDRGEEVPAGMPVQWAECTPSYRIPTAVCEMVQARTVPVVVPDDSGGRTVMVPLYGEATAEPPPDEYHKEHRFVMLGMRGRLLRVRVHGEFASQAERQAAAALTCHTPDFGRDMWRPATTESEPAVVVGWASIEDPDWQNRNGQLDAADSENNGPIPRSGGQGEAVYAFFLTRITKANGGLGYGNWTGRQTVFQVLFLRPVEISGFGTCYERLGIGRLFGNDIDAAFQKLSDSGLVWLV